MQLMLSTVPSAELLSVTITSIQFKVTALSETLT